MSNTNKEAPPRTEGLGPSQQRKRKTRADFDDAENTHPCFSNLNNTSVALSNIFPRVLADISNVHPNFPSSTVSIGNTPTNAQSSNQTTVSNIGGGSIKRKISATIEVTENTPSMFSRKKRGAKSGVPMYFLLPIHYLFNLEHLLQVVPKGKGKVLAGDNKLTKTITKSCKKTLEAQFDGCVDGNSSSEDDEDQAYQCDYEAEESELYEEQVYDCSSEESDTSDSEPINADPILSTDTSHRSPDVLSKTNTKTASSCTRKTKSASSRKQYELLEKFNTERDSNKLRDEENTFLMRLERLSTKESLPENVEALGGSSPYQIISCPNQINRLFFDFLQIVFTSSRNLGSVRTAMEFCFWSFKSSSGSSFLNKTT
ncbi:hypothetical protein Bca4012_063937 [Brassica carinata]